MAYTYPLPTATSIRAASKVDWDALGYPVGDPPTDPDPLQELVDEAIAYIALMTCRSPLSENVPEELAPLFNQAIRMRVEQIAFKASEDAVESSTDDQVKSFSAGSYSETRGGSTKRTDRSLNPWNDLDDLIWALMTDECVAKWQEQLAGVFAPAFDVTEVDWDGSHGGIYPPGTF